MTQKALLQGAGDGTAVPVGYVGELIESNVNSVNVTTTIASATSITLTPGVWDIGATVGINTNANGNGWCLIGVSTSSSAVIGSQGKNFTYTGSISSIGFTTSATLTPSRVILTSNTTYHAVIQSNANMTSAGHVYIRAVRIA